MNKFLFFIFIAFSLNNANAQCNQLFFSEYVEGSGNDKALEIYNPTNSAINLTNYWVKRYGNGSIDATGGGITQLSGVIQPHSTFILVNGQTTSTATSPACSVALQNLILSPNNGMLDGVFPAPCYFNGDDALTLEYGVSSANTTIIDVFGKIGEDPGVAWTNIPPFTDGGGGIWITTNHTLTRKASVLQGVTSNPTMFDALLEYDTLSNNTWSNLGTHNCNCPTNSCNLSVVNQSQSQTVNAGTTAQFSVTASSNCNYVWQTNIGFGFQNLSNAGQYTGSNTNTLSISNVASNNNSQIFRCIISQGVCADTSNQILLTVSTCALIINTQPQNQNAIVGNSAQFNVTATANATYQWQTNIGFGFQNLSNAGQYNGAFQNTLNINNLTLTNNNQSFRCIVSLNNCIDTTNVVVLLVTTPVDIEKLIENSRTIYPNPINDYLFVDYSKLKIDKIEILDLLGKVVISEKIENGNRINTSNLPSGIYFLKLGNNNNKQKIIKY